MKKPIVWLFLGPLLLLGAVTIFALEGEEVVVLTTHANDGTTHTTRVWVADYDGAAWIEAATAERAFYRDLATDPELDVTRGGKKQRYRASLQANPEGHERIRSLLSARYGWADAWIGLLTDTSASCALRLERLADAKAAPPGQ